MYNLFLYIKWIKYAKLKLPLKVRSYSYYAEDDLQSIAGFPNMLYRLRTKSNLKAVATFRNYKHFSIRKKLNDQYISYMYYWNFLGYENQKPIKDCSLKEFKDIYTTFFYPHLISGDEITSRLVLAELAPDKKESIKQIYLIR